MTEQEILKIMAEVKRQVEADARASKAYRYEDMRERKIKEIYVFYPEIAELTAGKFKELWDAA